MTAEQSALCGEYFVARKTANETRVILLDAIAAEEAARRSLLVIELRTKHAREEAIAASEKVNNLFERCCNAKIQGIDKPRSPIV